MILKLLNEYYGTESTTLEEFVLDVKESSNQVIPFHVYKFLRYVERKEGDRG